MKTAEASEEDAEAASAAALGGATEQDDEADKPYQTQAEAHTPGGGDKADVEEEDEGVEEDDDDKPDFMKKKGFADVEESYYPEDHDIRSKARFQMNEALMKRWGYSKK